MYILCKRTYIGGVGKVYKHIACSKRIAILSSLTVTRTLYYWTLMWTVVYWTKFKRIRPLRKLGGLFFLL